MTKSKGKKTMTDKAIAANQANAQHSTGSGNYENSRWNADYHGQRSSRVVLKYESREEYQAFSDKFYKLFKPEGAYEFELVKTIADNYWERERMLCLKSQVIENHQYRDVMEAEITKLNKYQVAMEKAIYRARNELRKEQAWRFKHEGSPIGPTYHDGPPGKRLPVFETETYGGPVIGYAPSQGEAAVDNLLSHAVSRAKRFMTPPGKAPLDVYLDKRADIELSLMDADLPPPPPRSLSDPPDQAVS